MSDFETPKLSREVAIPAIRKDAMSHSRPAAASAEHQRALGFPEKLVDDWHEVAIAKMGQLLDEKFQVPTNSM